MLSPGAGYYFIKDTNTDLSVEAGPGYVVEKLGDVRKNYATLRVGEKFHHAVSDRARVWETAEWLPQVDDLNNYIINGEVGVEADLNVTGKLSLRAYVQDTYNNVPVLEPYISGTRDTRFARRATRESDGLNGSEPGVALADSGNPGLISSTPLVSPSCRATRGTRRTMNTICSF